MVSKQPQWVLATDIDNTLTGDEPALRQLAQELGALRQKGELFLILSTGRRLEDVLSGFEREGLPEPDAIISQVGTEIYLPPFSPGMAPLAAWEERLQQRFARNRALNFLEAVEGVAMQPDEFNTPLKVSVYLDQAPDPHAAAERVLRRIESADDGGEYRVLWSSGRDLDIIPEAAGKGNAIRYLLKHLELDPNKLVVAGDSGNDLSMFETFPCGIVVANAQPELDILRGDTQSDHFFATAKCAGGVTEGLRHFGLIEDQN